MQQKVNTTACHDGSKIPLETWQINTWKENQQLKATNMQVQLPEAITFTGEGDAACKTNIAAKNPFFILQQASEWEMSVNPKRKLVFPQEVAVLMLWPDIGLQIQ